MQMPRRASSSSNPWWVAGTLVCLAAVTALGFLLYRTVADPFRLLTPLDVPAYLENANSLRGNVYKVVAVVDSKLAWSPAVGSLYAVDADTHHGSTPLPLLVPAEFNHVNIQKGQKLRCRVEVGDKGVLIARQIEKA